MGQVSNLNERLLSQQIKQGEEDNTAAAAKSAGREAYCFLLPIQFGQQVKIVQKRKARIGLLPS